MTHTWVMGNNCLKYYPDPIWQWGVMARTWISGMCALWPWRYNLESRPWHALESWITIVWNIIQIELGSEELWPGHGFLVCVHCDLDLGDMTLGHCHDTPFGHGQELCEILSRSNSALRIMARTRILGVNCDLDLGDMTLGKGHDTPLGHGQQLCEYYPDPTWHWGLWPGHGFPVSVHCDLDLGDMTLGQCHDTPFGHGQ